MQLYEWEGQGMLSTFTQEFFVVSIYILSICFSIDTGLG